MQYRKELSYCSWLYLSGCVTVGNGTHIGTGSSIIQGISIGKNVLIGAGSVVVNDIEDNSKAYGVPAKMKNTSSCIEWRGVRK